MVLNFSVQKVIGATNMSQQLTVSIIGLNFKSLLVQTFFPINQIKDQALVMDLQFQILEKAAKKISLLLIDSILFRLAKQYIDFKLRMSGIVAYGYSWVHSL